MPLYEYQCSSCGRCREVLCSVKEHRPAHHCPCGGTQRQVLSAPMVTPDIQPYRSMIDGSVIGSRSTHRAHLRQHDVIEIGNERLPPRKWVPMPDLVPDLRQAIREVKRKS